METTGIRLWLILWKAYDSVAGHARAHISGLGLGYSDFAVLEVLLHKGPMPVNAIGSVVRLTSGAITTAVDRLEDKKLVKRRNDAADRRARIVHLTPAGRKWITEAFREHQAAMERATSGLTPAERSQAAELLKKLGRHAQAELEQRPGGRGDSD